MFILAGANEAVAGGDEEELRAVLTEALRLLSLALLPCHRHETPSLFEVGWCAELLGGLERNLLSVEVECPALNAAPGSLSPEETALIKAAAAAVAAKIGREVPAAAPTVALLRGRAVKVRIAPTAGPATSAGWPRVEVRQQPAHSVHSSRRSLSHVHHQTCSSSIMFITRWSAGGRAV